MNKHFLKPMTTVNTTVHFNNLPKLKVKNRV